MNRRVDGRDSKAAAIRAASPRGRGKAQACEAGDGGEQTADIESFHFLTFSTKWFLLTSPSLTAGTWSVTTLRGFYCQFLHRLAVTLNLESTCGEYCVPEMAWDFCRDAGASTLFAIC